ncbi:hypothetical protein AJ79_02133 [Helicocarpus griseus UAMH5409]|uniref:Hydrophobin n=1 Tax=Helicocarpus griseus UAMH5409 TaxID=1447875 RepID=A0A2B7Y394_9EURO|nr:hypothetical protein AJ79_02133 [Helicocarpus griseus UAMH5409]
MNFVKFLAAAALITGTLASLNCTSTAEITYYCCPDEMSEQVKTSAVGAFIEFGCAVDETDKGWFWHYNGLFTQYTTEVKDCYLNLNQFDDLAVLPDCAEDTIVLEYTCDAPLRECNPNCVSEDDLPPVTFFGDKQEGDNFPEDFPPPTAWDPPPPNPDC